MRSYKAARGSFGVFETLARGVSWFGIAVLLLGAFVAFMTLGDRLPTIPLLILGAIPGGIIAMAGYYGVAMAQMGRASVDSAEYGQQSLQLSREQFAHAKEAFRWQQQQVGTTGYHTASGDMPGPITFDTANADRDQAHLDATTTSTLPSNQTAGELEAPVPDLNDLIKEELPEAVSVQFGVNSNA
jgi:hypothetical protein